MLKSDDVGEALRRGWLGGGGLRREDEQKAQELAPLLDEVGRMAAKRSAKQPFVLVDACAGKGALGVLASVLVLRDRPHRVVAIERDEACGPRCLEAGRILGMSAELTFTAGDVADTPGFTSEPDLIVALHACGGASDLVIDAAIAVDARALLLVPCCYGAGPRHDGAGSEALRSRRRSRQDGGRAARKDGLDVRAQPLADAWAAHLPLPAHGLVGKRVAQGLIDAERTLRLESAGFETEVLEVFPPTLSPHNILWRARRVKEPVRMARARETLEALARPPR